MWWRSWSGGMWRDREKGAGATGYGQMQDRERLLLP